MDHSDALGRIDEDSCEFMLADIQTAHAFLDDAGASGTIRAQLNIQKARDLFGTVTLCLVNATIDPAKRARIEKELGDLRSRLDSFEHANARDVTRSGTG
jgi:hypothetical protein